MNSLHLIDLVSQNVWQFSICILGLLFSFGLAFSSGWISSYLSREINCDDEKALFKSTIRERLNVASLFSLVLSVSSLIILFYVSNFKTSYVSNQVQDWAHFGSYIGGTVGAIFAFGSFIALLYTINIQTEQLKLSRKELAETRAELARSATAQETSQLLMSEQLKNIEKQRFESSLFMILERVSESFETAEYISQVRRSIDGARHAYQVKGSNGSVTSFMFEMLQRDIPSCSANIFFIHQYIKAVFQKCDLCEADASFYVDLLLAKMGAISSFFYVIFLDAQLDQNIKKEELASFLRSSKVLHNGLFYDIDGELFISCIELEKRPQGANLKNYIFKFSSLDPEFIPRVKRTLI